MKSYEKIAQDIFKRRDEYLAEKKRKRAVWKKNLCSGIGMGLVALAAITVWNNDAVRSAIPYLSNSPYIITTDSITGELDGTTETPQATEALTVTTAVGQFTTEVTAPISTASSSKTTTTVSSAVTDVPVSSTTATYAAATASSVSTSRPAHTTTTTAAQTTSRTSTSRPNHTTTTTTAEADVPPATITTRTNYTTTTTARTDHTTTTTARTDHTTTTTARTDHTTTTTARTDHTTTTTARTDHTTTTTARTDHTTTTTTAPPVISATMTTTTTAPAPFIDYDFINRYLSTVTDSYGHDYDLSHTTVPEDELLDIIDVPVISVTKEDGETISIIALFYEVKNMPLDEYAALIFEDMTDYWLYHRKT